MAQDVLEYRRWVGPPAAGSMVFLKTGEALYILKAPKGIGKELEQTEKELASIQARLANPQFIEKAAAPVIEKARTRASELEVKREKLNARRAMLGG